MPDASGLLALGQALDQYLLGEYSPPPGTQTALGFVPGVAVNPSSFAPTGVVNPLAVQTFLNSVANVLGPVVDGRFAGFMSAQQIYGMVIDVASPLDAPGTPAADAFLSVKNTARSAFGVSPVKQLVAIPMNWYDAANTEGWSTFTTATREGAGEQQASSAGDTSSTPPVAAPPIVAPTERFEQLWRWRTLDEAALADVVIPAQEAVGEVSEPVVVRDHRVERYQPEVFDHRSVDLSGVAVRDHRSLSGVVRNGSATQLRAAASVRPLMSRSVAAADGAEVDASATQVLARAPRRQLVAALAEDQPGFAANENVMVRSQALAHLIRVETPVLVAEIDDDAETSSSQSVESHELNLSLEYCFVQVSREAWWNDAVLRMPRWYAPGCRSGAFSSGASVGGLPLGVPIAMVLTRNVSVTGQWSEADRSAAESHTSFGPWSMHDSAMSYEESTDTATLTIPGMQVVAVVCALLPQLAPADDPVLGPAAGGATQG
jgi:hypothetical protein